ncbi:type II toxin-antitoxin system HicA family toxin [Neomoorella thermoacetica]|uniref:type II toxin-antitoxin system HicA family toxin n=1 Tax=Neomoorella thermoacetica TaxID=1525 RepID=UPI00056B4B6A|nr:type II toxin-antitoxin system HicA family toxin [Moorella thermoacetica]OIQ11503.1 YcfA-like protein [Moorella thermoacetica]
MSIFLVISGQEVVRALQKGGFVKVSQKGSHVKLRKSEENIRTVIVPLHEELAPGTLKSILRQSGLTVKELKKLLNC